MIPEFPKVSNPDAPASRHFVCQIAEIIVTHSAPDVSRSLIDFRTELKEYVDCGHLNESSSKVGGANQLKLNRFERWLFLKLGCHHFMADPSIESSVKTMLLYCVYPSGIAAIGSAIALACLYFTGN